jgi:hypothetical protein
LLVCAALKTFVSSNGNNVGLILVFSGTINDTLECFQCQI